MSHLKGPQIKENSQHIRIMILTPLSEAFDNYLPETVINFLSPLEKYFQVLFLDWNEDWGPAAASTLGLEIGSLGHIIEILKYWELFENDQIRFGIKKKKKKIFYTPPSKCRSNEPITQVSCEAIQWKFFKKIVENLNIDLLKILTWNNPTLAYFL